MPWQHPSSYSELPFIKARTESIRAQLDGKLATKTSDQDISARIDASNITISDMGSQKGGKEKNSSEKTGVVPEEISKSGDDQKDN